MTRRESSTDTSTVGRSTTTWLAVRARNLVRYALVAVAIVAAYHFLAPAAGLPVLSLYQQATPSLIAPTEGDAVVDATHAVIMCVAAALAVKI
jgi:hypothetical protein